MDAGCYLDKEQVLSALSVPYMVVAEQESSIYSNSTSWTVSETEKAVLERFYLRSSLLSRSWTKLRTDSLLRVSRRNWLRVSG
ncbi:hypothetical protein AOLI_G00007900 [Acnodon oligacanthus]